MPIKTSGYAVMTAGEALKPWTFEHKDVGDDDVHIQVQYCGICHSDVHQGKNEWFNGNYPMVPGHEVVGVVVSVGKNVTKLKKGDKAGIGCMVGSCRSCHHCVRDEEQYCRKGMIGTYNGKYPDGKSTYGGYGKDIVANQHFVLCWPQALDMCAGAPLLCAGITVYSPIMKWGMNKPGLNVGVVGLGGLGHMAVKFLVSFGCNVTVISRSAGKEQEAKQELGAQKFLNSSDEKAMAAAAGSLDFIIDTASAKKAMDPLINLLTVNGTIVIVGAAPEPMAVSAFSLLLNRRSVAGSLIGGIKETQEMLDYCAKKNITCKIEKISMDKVNEAWERVIKSDVRYRFVLDVEGYKGA